MFPFQMVVFHAFRDANRKWLSPGGTNRSRHSSLIESTNRSAKALPQTARNLTDSVDG
jgi:hypothetical protein